MSITIEECKRYVTQDGEVVGPFNWRYPNHVYPWCDTDTNRTYTVNGVYDTSKASGNDLVREYIEPSIPVDPGPAATEDSVPLIRQFETGATRNLDGNKLDYEGFFSPLAMKSFAEYMHSHRKQKDGTLRDADNWQKGIPLDVYMKSMWRHFMDVWSLHRGGSPVSPDTGNPVDMEEALNAVMFNVQGYLHETLKRRDSGDV